MNPPNSSRARGAGFKVAGLKRTRKCEAAGGRGGGGGSGSTPSRKIVNVSRRKWAENA